MICGLFVSYKFCFWVIKYNAFRYSDGEYLVCFLKYRLNVDGSGKWNIHATSCTDNVADCKATFISNMA